MLTSTKKKKEKLSKTNIINISDRVYVEILIFIRRYDIRKKIIF
jgi:hypothetical protein